MQVVILCGGEGTRFKNDINNITKVLAPIGSKPILWHIMRYYQSYGFDDFILCLGSNKAQITAFFAGVNEFGSITLVDTGEGTPTGGRIKQIQKLITGDTFLATYGDGLSDINLSQLIHFHSKQNKIATLCAIQPHSQYGVMTLNNHDHVTNFVEKPKLKKWVNGGFFVFNKEIFNYLENNKSLEDSIFGKLVTQSALSAFKHEGFWKSMDTYKENIELNQLWDKQEAPWKKW